MLYVFGFDKVCVVLGDLYFVDPDPLKGQEGAERGVRLELRVIQRGELKESIYASTPIEVDQPIWRADFLEDVDGKPFDRTHHHPVFTGWDPGDRVFERALSADPLAWLESKLSNLGELLTSAQFPLDTAGPDDEAELRRAAPEIVDATRRLLERVRAGELGVSPDPDAPLLVDGQWQLVRSGWL
ncbi:hypothetical protein SAMN04488564_11536 [Lentzea waywayandensis]|uniref:Uncharacterized protein n=1 Tax=Lentzea waywayandensis TaxID=84724 RepID=A0A1I6FFM6_9PSEU|nr:hypothetical protein [Lentzea waywayandensis]SFR28728.1 hypothetical protein SAMN04488564_11536 [Lentzea waywayandensis]